MTNAANYVLLTFCHHTLKWPLERIRSGSSTAGQIAMHYEPNEKSPARRTIEKGLVDLLKVDPKQLPEIFHK